MWYERNNNCVGIKKMKQGDEFLAWSKESYAHITVGSNLALWPLAKWLLPS